MFVIEFGLLWWNWYLYKFVEFYLGGSFFIYRVVGCDVIVIF